MRSWCVLGLFCAMFYTLHGGEVCAYKLHLAREGLQEYQAKPNPDSSKLDTAQKELKKLESSCDDEAVLREVREHIMTTKAELHTALEQLISARESGDTQKILAAELSYKIAKSQYIAARQEELILLDIAKSSHNVH